MDLYLLVGNTHTRKSSVARSLTGCFNRSVRDIALSSGRSTLRLYARVGALQETRTSPEDFVQEVARQRCDAVLCCLAPDALATLPAAPSARPQYPAASDYLEHFAQAGWQLRSIAALGQNSGGLRSPLLRHFPQAGTDPINATAHAVRKHFGWV
jgi:hypothetical protein